MTVVWTMLSSRLVLVSATIAILVVAAAEWGVRFYAAMVNAPTVIGLDAHFYFDRANAWLAGDGFYLPWQLTGQPYIFEQGAVTYPPPMLLLLVPFKVVPQILWWAIPLVVLGVSLVRLRPAAWTWPLLALVLIYPRTWVVVALGNPSMWAIAAFVAGLAWSWPAVGALLKPTFAPLALIGIRRRSWWIGLAVVVAVSLPFGSMWIDYANAMLHGGTSRGLEYLLGEWPIALLLGVAWLGRSAHNGQAPLKRSRDSGAQHAT